MCVMASLKQSGKHCRTRASSSKSGQVLLVSLCPLGRTYLHHECNGREALISAGPWQLPHQDPQLGEHFRGRSTNFGGLWSSELILEKFYQDSCSSQPSLSRKLRPHSKLSHHPVPSAILC